jgi:Raf kinase inhibitor-like YbhB/YbcL family protein
MGSSAVRFGGALSLLYFASIFASVACSGEDAPVQGASGSANTTGGAASGAPAGGSTAAGTTGNGGANSSGTTSGGTTSGGNASGGTVNGGAAGSSGASNNGGTTSGGNGGTAGSGTAGSSAGSGGAGGGSGGTAGSAGAGSFAITSPAFANQAGCAKEMAASCATFPRNMTNYGDNVSPAMSWSGAPAGTQSFVVLLQDLTNGNAHWVLWNIPASVTSLAENVPKASAMPATPQGSQQCSIGTGDGYFGPGACGNVYEFVVYALSVPSFTPTMATNQTMVRQQLLALGNSILGTASMRGRSFAPNCP